MARRGAPGRVPASLRPRRSGATRRRRPAARRSVRRWRWRLHSRPTCCCSTSPPIISTSTASSSSRTWCAGRGGHRDHARSRVSRQRGHAHRRTGSRPAALVSRQLRRLRGAPNRRACRGKRREPQVRQVLEAGRGVDPQGRGGSPHARHGTRAPSRGAAPRTRAAPRPAGRREDGARCGRAFRQARRRAQPCRQAVRRARHRRRSRPAGDARRSARHHRCQRRGQVDAAEVDPRRVVARHGHGEARHQAAGRVLRPAARAARSGAHARRHDQPGLGVGRDSPTGASTC